MGWRPCRRVAAGEQAAAAAAAAAAVTDGGSGGSGARSDAAAEQYARQHAAGVIQDRGAWRWGGVWDFEREGQLEARSVEQVNAKGPQGDQLGAVLQGVEG